MCATAGDLPAAEPCGVDRSKRLDVAHRSNCDIVLGRRECELGQHRDAEAGRDESSRDRHVVHLVDDVRLEAGFRAEAFEQYAVGMECSSRRGGEALSSQVRHRKLAAAHERMARRKHHPVWIVREVRLVEAFVGLIAPVREPLLHAISDCQVEIAGAQVAQLLRLFDVLQPDLYVGVRGFEASQGLRHE
jgi:hypothetical protein